MKVTHYTRLGLVHVSPGVGAVSDQSHADLFDSTIAIKWKMVDVVFYRRLEQ